MLPKDKQLINKLKRRISVLVLLSLSLIYWIRINYYDLDWKNTEVESLQHEIVEKDREIKSLQYKVDSIITSTTSKKIEIPKIIINTKKKELKPKMDSVKIDGINLPTINEIETQTNDSTNN